MTASKRLVVLLFGPPGAGKTTTARESGLQVFDRDDPQWTGEQHFRFELSELRSDPTARAVVIRAGATSSARKKAADLVGATHLYLVSLPADECRRRVQSRARHDHVQGSASVKTWHDAFDADDGVADFPGWQFVVAGETSIGATTRDW